MSGFDPYLIWLDIPPHERPATYYRLLGLRPLEQNPQVISSAAERVLAHVGRFQQTEHASACAQLLSELTAARDCLLDPTRKQAYDSGFSNSAPATSTPAAQPAERPIPSAPQPLGQSGIERQIAQSPPVPGVAPSSSGGPLPLQSPAPTISKSVGGEQQLPSAIVPVPTQANASSAPQAPSPYSTQGVPTSVYPPATQPSVMQPGAVQPSPTPSAGPATNYPPSVSQPANNPPGSPVAPPNPAVTAPPSWAAAQPTGDVRTVTAGQPSPNQPASSPTRHARQLRRTQQTQSAYMLVGIAMAMIVFFFGAILLLAIYLGAQ